MSSSLPIGQSTVKKDFVDIDAFPFMINPKKKEGRGVGEKVRAMSHKYLLILATKTSEAPNTRTFKDTQNSTKSRLW